MSKLRVDPTNVYFFIATCLIQPILRSSYLVRKVKNLSDIIDFSKFCSKQFPNYKITYTRNKAIDKCFEMIVNPDLSLSLGSNRSYQVVEFGVAHGYLADRCFGSKSSSRKKRRVILPSRWDGFDTFTGLPEEWRDRSEGEFSNFGKLPDQRSKKTFYHKGLINSTFSTERFRELKISDHAVFFIFDFDLHSPTFFAYQAIKESISPGDILYFDQAFDSAERSVLIQALDEFEFKLVTATLWSIAVMVEEKNPSECVI